jgi:uncharacterized protein YbbC (DUF1343 family)
MLNELGLEGVTFEAITFVPEKMSFHSRDPYLTGEECNGISVVITDRDLFEPYKAGIAMVWAIHELHPDKLEWNQKTMDRLVSTRRLENMIFDGTHPSGIFASWEQELADFREMREGYLLY